MLKPLNSGYGQSCGHNIKSMRMYPTSELLAGFKKDAHGHGHDSALAHRTCGVILHRLFRVCSSEFTITQELWQTPGLASHAKYTGNPSVHTDHVHPSRPVADASSESSRNSMVHNSACF